jgi:hypothetical protein
MTAVQAWLRKLYIETALLFDTQCPFKSQAVFYKGLINQTDVEALTTIGDSTSRESKKVRDIEQQVQDINSPLTSAMAHLLVNLYVQFCRYRTKKLRKTMTSASAFTSITQFYCGLNLSSEDVERLKRIQDDLRDVDKKVIEEAEHIPKKEEWERKRHEEAKAKRAELKAKCLARDREAIIGLFHYTEKELMEAADPLAYVRDNLPAKRRRIELETGIDFQNI